MVTTHAPTGLETADSSAFVDPSSESVVYFFPVKSGSKRHIKNWIRSAHEAKYIPSCAHPCGAPLLSEIWRARMRVAMKSTESMGANCTVVLADSTASFTKVRSMLVKSSTVMKIQSRM